jgi:hypothetical protein
MVTMRISYHADDVVGAIWKQQTKNERNVIINTPEVSLCLCLLQLVIFASATKDMLEVE